MNDIKFYNINLKVKKIKGCYYTEKTTLKEKIYYIKAHLVNLNNYFVFKDLIAFRDSLCLIKKTYRKPSFMFYLLRFYLFIFKRNIYKVKYLKIKQIGWSESKRKWIKECKLFNITLFYIGSIQYKDKNGYLKNNKRTCNPKIKKTFYFKKQGYIQTKPLKTYVYLTKEEIRSEYKNYWDTPTNEDWRFIDENGKEITLKQVWE